MSGIAQEEQCLWSQPVAGRVAKSEITAFSVAAIIRRAIISVVAIKGFIFAFSVMTRINSATIVVVATFVIFAFSTRLTAKGQHAELIDSRFDDSGRSSGVNVDNFNLPTSITTFVEVASIKRTSARFDITTRHTPERPCNSALKTTNTSDGVDGV
jgi:ABC-type xylose transport system permease subunit